jgi:ABC-type nickel/cobalt efflux system permease component RcnA
MLNYSSLLHVYIIITSKLLNVSTAIWALWHRGKNEGDTPEKHSTMGTEQQWHNTFEGGGYKKPTTNVCSTQHSQASHHPFLTHNGTHKRENLSSVEQLSGTVH